MSLLSLVDFADIIHQRVIEHRPDDVFEIWLGREYLVVYLPLVLKNYATFPVFIGEDVPERPAAYEGEVFATTMVFIPAQLPQGGHFYLSSQRDRVMEVSVDDEIAALLGEVEQWKYNFSPGCARVVPQVVEVPREVVEVMAGQMATFERRDTCGTDILSSTIWLIWVDD